MASGKAKRQRDEVEVEELPATKRHAAADGPLKGLQQVRMSAFLHTHLYAVGPEQGKTMQAFALLTA